MLKRKFKLISILTLFFLQLIELKSENLHLIIYGLDSFKGKQIKARVLEKGSNKKISHYYKSSIEESILKIKLVELQNGKNYSLEVFIDVNDNGKYDSNTVDRSWKININNFNQKEQIELNTYDLISNVYWDNYDYSITIVIDRLDKIKNNNLIAKIKMLPTSDEQMEVGSFKIDVQNKDSISFQIKHDISIRDYCPIILEITLDKNKNNRIDINDEIRQYVVQYIENGTIRIREKDKFIKKY